MLQSILVYYCTTLLMMGLVLIPRRTSFKVFGFSISTLIALLLFAVVCGVRYGVGMDYFSYLKIFTYNNTDRLEPGFAWVVSTLHNMGLHYSWFFGTVAFLQMFFVFQRFKNDKWLLAFIVFAFMSIQYLSWMNGLRQIISVAIFIYAIEFIRKREWLKYYLCVLLAFLFHKSAILLALVYPLFVGEWYKKEWSVKLQVVGVVTSLFLGNLMMSIQNAVFGALNNYLVMLEYDHYSEYEHMGDSTKGLGFYLMFFLVLMAIRYNNKMKLEFRETSFSIFYSLFYLGYIYGNLVIGSIVLARPNYYFVGLNFIVIGYLMKYLWGKRLFIPLSLVMITLLLLLFAMIWRGDTGTGTYYFFWQK